MVFVMKKEKIIIFTLLSVIMLIVIWAAVPAIEYFLSLLLGDNTIEHKIKFGNDMILRFNVVKKILVGF